MLALGRRGANGVSASFGVISAVSGPWRTWRGGQIERFIRPDVNIYPGFSGGALVDAEGGVIGLNTSGLTRGVGVTVPASAVSRVTDELLSRGHVRRGFLGVGLHPVQLPDGGRGLIVLSLEPGGPAHKAGVFVGDVLLTLDGEAVDDTDAVQSHLGGADRQSRHNGDTARWFADTDRYCTGGTAGAGKVEMTMPGYEAVVERLRRSTVQVVNGRGGGSGVVWGAPGVVVTNAHVISSRHVSVVDAGGRRRSARVLKQDRERDLALLEIPEEDLELAEIGDSASVRSGQIVVAVGYPMGITGAVAMGMIHAIGPLGFGARKNWIQADVRPGAGQLGRRARRCNGARDRD